MELVAQAVQERLHGSGDYGSARNKNLNALVGVQVNVPLYTGGYRAAREEEALRLQDKAQAQAYLQYPLRYFPVFSHLPSLICHTAAERYVDCVFSVLKTLESHTINPLKQDLKHDRLPYYQKNNRELKKNAIDPRPSEIP